MKLTPLALATAMAVFLLSGCNTTTAGTKGPNAQEQMQNAQRVALVRAQQYQLWDEGIMNTRNTVPADTIYANSTLVSLDWNGDAVELLQQLAIQRGLKLSVGGVRLPLPLNIHVRDITFQNLLRVIESQTSWRAKVQQLPGLLHIEFMPTQGPARKQGKP